MPASRAALVTQGLRRRRLLDLLLMFAPNSSLLQ